MSRLDGKVALVIGGTSGIGNATARELATKGARVVFAGRRREQGEQSASELRHEGLDAHFIPVDVRLPDSIAELVDATVGRFGHLDIAVNNAGMAGVTAPIHEYPAESWDEVIAVNLRGVWLSMKCEIQHMLGNGGGVIVNTASDVGLVGAPFGIGAYVASKHGVIGLTRAAALEYAGQSIRVNAVCPGLTDTDMLTDAKINHPDMLANYLNAHIPMRRPATAIEQAKAILWLCSSDSSFVTGHALVVDGGILAK
jgi:NAD(P)-dependent dehydrogenase (short-subunit alcohol dehydrogenase family)